MESEFGAFYDSVTTVQRDFHAGALTFYFVSMRNIAASDGARARESIMVSYSCAGEGLGYECKTGLMQRPTLL
jgi:hypothetical protein